METKKCKTCNIEKELSEFTRNRTNYKPNCKNCYARKQRDRYKNDPKVRELSKKHRELNKEKYGVEYKKEYYLKNKEKCNALNKKNYEKNKLDHYIVYYLPEVNYCGVTNSPAKRMDCHKYYGNDTTGWKVLATTETKKEALEIESKYHSEKGMNGARGWKLQSKNE